MIISAVGTMGCVTLSFSIKLKDKFYKVCYVNLGHSE